MKTVLFSKEGDTLILRYNLKAARGTVLLISTIFIIITIVLYLLTNGAKMPGHPPDFIFIGLMFGLYLLTMAYYAYTIFSMRQVELLKNYEGYVVRRNNKIRTGIIKRIIKRRVMRQHDEGYSIVVNDKDNKWYTLFATLPEAEALELAQTLSAAMNLPLESTEADGWL